MFAIREDAQVVVIHPATAVKFCVDEYAYAQAQAAFPSLLADPKWT
jgi:hypothetical protein